MALPGQVSVPNKGGLLLVNAATGTTTVPTLANQGSLYEAKGFKNYNFQVKGISTATVTLYGTLDPAAAANPTGAVSAQWTVIGAPLTTDGFQFVNGPFIAVAAAVTAYTSGTISVYVLAVP